MPSMRVKRFVAATLPEAMLQVKAEMGTDAVILHTNEVKVGGIMGLFGRRMIQVMAAVDDTAVLAAAERPTAAPAPALAKAAPVRAMPQAPIQTPTPAPMPAPSAAQGPEAPKRSFPLPAELVAVAQAAAVREEISDMKVLMGEIMDRLNQPGAALPMEPELRELQRSLQQGGVEEPAAQALIGRVRTLVQQGKGTLADSAQLARQLIRSELSSVRTVGGLGRVVALVGPTGVGKTTTLAKLAAHLVLQQRKRIALVTADTYRIAAVEQLRTYSEIIGMPLEVVYDPSEVAAALGKHADCDLILVDTAGRSPRNHAHMDELKLYLETLKPSETYLVLSLTSSYRDAVNIVEHYLPLGFDEFLFTKWDEAASPGLIYSIVHKYRRPLSYVTTGQNVPDDIEVANPETITRAILGV